MEDRLKLKIGDLVQYDPKIFDDFTLSQTHQLPFGWIRDEFEGCEPDWLGVISQVKENMWGKYGGLGYEVIWTHGYVEKVYAFEIEKVVDKSTES